MGFLNDAKNAAVNGVIAILLPYLNRQIARYGQVTTLTLTDGVPEASVRLAGIIQPITVSCDYVAISEDGSVLSLDSFHSDAESIQHILEDFAPRDIELPENIRPYMRQLRRLL